jgi:ribulose kinase
MQAAGYSYNWYRNTLCLDEIAKGKERGENPYKLIDSAALASPPGAGGLLYLPYLLGERSPRWNHDARGAFVGLSVSTGKGDISRAVLEGVGFNLKIILDILERGAAAGGISEVIMIGGGAKGAVWLNTRRHLAETAGGSRLHRRGDQPWGGGLRRGGHRRVQGFFRDPRVQRPGTAYRAKPEPRAGI